MSYIGKVNSMSCLYLIQADYVATEHALAQIKRVYQAGDAVVVMGDAVLHPQSFTFDDVYILEHDAQMLSTLPEQAQVISYAGFADLSLTYQRCVRFK